MLNNAAHFIFDSEHIADIPPRLYGFYVTEDGQFTSLPDDDISHATGAWVLVRHTPEGIEITQDAIGCFGLFLFRSGACWALSNSFNHLLDYLKNNHKLTVENAGQHTMPLQRENLRLFNVSPSSSSANRLKSS